MDIRINPRTFHIIVPTKSERAKRNDMKGAGVNNVNKAMTYFEEENKDENTTTEETATPAEAPAEGGEASTTEGEGEKASE